MKYGSFDCFRKRFMFVRVSWGQGAKNVAAPNSLEYWFVSTLNNVFSSVVLCKDLWINNASLEKQAFVTMGLYKTD